MSDLETADTEPVPPLLDHESSGRMFADDDDCEIDGEYDASARCAVIEHDPIAEALCEATLQRMGLR